MKPGNAQLLAAIARTRSARTDDPVPYDDTWGWWVNERITKLERGQLWLIRIGIAALVAEVIRIISSLAGLGG